ncbi:hypothetical protein MMC07_006790 [Pseudocyphellaria aurata]|nr:hypothetical protein [Pseudocyphellaria aurata]
MTSKFICNFTISSKTIPSLAKITERESLRHYSKFKKRRDDISIASAVQWAQAALDLTPESDPDRAERLSNLSVFLIDRYGIEDKLNDLNQAIDHAQIAVNLTPESDPDRAGRLRSLSVFYYFRYEKRGKVGTLDDLNQAIEHGQAAVNLTPESNPYRAGRLSTLGVFILYRYNAKGKVDDFNQAIEYLQAALNLTPESNNSRAVILNNCSQGCWMRCMWSERGEEFDALGAAIKFAQRAVNLAPKKYYLEPHNNDLITPLPTQYQIEGKLNDLILHGGLWHAWQAIRKGKGLRHLRRAFGSRQVAANRRPPGDQNRA